MKTPLSNVVLVLAVAIAGSPGVSGCSIAGSAKSSSRASSSPSDWSSASSRSSSRESVEDRQTIYEEDVSQTTTAFVRGGGQLASFERVLGQLAERHGIDHWEKDAATLKAIGVGIARATEDTARRTDVASEIAGGDARRKQLIEEGMASAD